MSDGSRAIKTRGITDPSRPRVRLVDFASIEEVGPDVRVSQMVIDEESGTEQTHVGYVRTPAGSGSSEGLHTHPCEQIFYMLKGTMTIEMEGERFELRPGEMIVFPAGVPHRNYNLGSEETINLSILTPITAGTPAIADRFPDTQK